MKERDRKIKNRMYRLYAALLAATVAVGLLCMLLVSQSNRAISAEAKRYLSELSQQTTNKVDSGIRNELDILQNVSITLTAFDKDPEENGEYFHLLTEKSPFDWIGYVDLKGTLYDNYVEDIRNVSGFTVIRNALNGISGVSPELTSVYDERQGALYAVPFYMEDELAGAVAGWIPAETMVLLLDTDTFQGYGYSHIVTTTGDFILHSSNANVVVEGTNYFETLESMDAEYKKEELSRVRADMLGKKSGAFEFTVSGEKRMMNYVPLAEGEWYLLSLISPSVYMSRINQLKYFALGNSICIVSLFLALIFYILWTKRREVSEIIQVDPVTGGFTSLRFEKEVNRIMRGGQAFAFITLDIRRFKLINDSYGKDDGNRVLKHVHDVLSSQLKAGECVSRIESDIFNLVIRETEQEEIRKRMKHMVDEINAFNEEQLIPYYLQINCGVYLVTNRSEDVITIRDRANVARKGSREAGDHLLNCMFYTDMERQKLHQEIEMENTMEIAMKNGEFQVYFQPKVSLATRKTAGAEALVRWNVPGRGIVPPGEFIPLFERNGFIIKIDQYVFGQTCALLRRWMDEGRELIPISVNLSRRHLEDPDFLKPYIEIRERYGVPAEFLEIELTEAMVFENLGRIKGAIDEIHRAGFHCSMDDFGSGYSSLNVLKEVPMDSLKMDRGFFVGENGPRGTDVVKAVIGLAKGLGMTVVAEGVESEDMVELLTGAGCDMIQGYIFAKPMPAAGFEEYVGRGGCS